MYTNMDIMMEKYIGKRAETRLIEDEFEKIIQYINARHKTVKDKSTHADEEGKAFKNQKMTSKMLTGLPEVRTIETLVKKLFGIKKCQIMIESRDTLNACTYVASSLMFDGDYKTLKKGDRVNKNLNINTVLNSGLITSAKLNKAELTAVLLHEIGHNFYDSIFHTLGSPMMFTLIDTPLLLIQKLPVLGPIFSRLRPNQISFEVVKWWEQTVFSFPGMTRVRDSLDAISSILNGLFPPFVRLNQVPLESIRTMFQGSLPTYNIEKHADSFAVDYGYGKELASALNKMSFNKGSVRHAVMQVPVISWVYDLNDLVLSNLSSILSGYPVPSNRIRTILDRLNRSAKDPDLDPRIRADLLKQIKEMEKYYYETYLNFSENENKQRPFTYMYRYVCEKAFNGKMDIRELIHALDPKKYK